MNLKTIIQSLAVKLVAVGGLLAGAVGLGQTYNPIHAPMAPSVYHWVYCYSIDTGQIVYNCPVGITTQFYVSTNAHFHSGSGQLRSSISCVNTLNQCSPASGLNISANTSTLGSVQVYTVGSLVGQAERLKAWPSSNPLAAAYKDYAVGYDDVFYNDHPEMWVKIGGSDTGGGTNHGSTAYNRYMKLNPPYYTSGPAYGLYYATNQYLQSRPPGTRVCTNDMALPFGGKFDVCNQLFAGCSGVFPWASPHSWHDRGAAGDVAGTGSVQCANAGGTGVNITEFIDRCVDNGALLQYSLNEGNHAHCQFENPYDSPH